MAGTLPWARPRPISRARLPSWSRNASALVGTRRQSVGRPTSPSSVTRPRCAAGLPTTAMPIPAARWFMEPTSRFSTASTRSSRPAPTRSCWPTPSWTAPNKSSEWRGYSAYGRVNTRPLGRLAMVRLFIRHAVTDYKAWRKVYDDFDAERRSMGVVGDAVYRAVDDPNDVTVW